MISKGSRDLVAKNDQIETFWSPGLAISAEFFHFLAQHPRLSTSSIPTPYTMADVDMPDVGSSTSAPTKAPVKSSKSGPVEGGADGRKRFEVKKVGTQLSYFLETGRRLTSIRYSGML